MPSAWFSPCRNLGISIWGIGIEIKRSPCLPISSSFVMYFLNVPPDPAFDDLLESVVIPSNP